MTSNAIGNLPLSQLQQTASVAKTAADAKLTNGGADKTVTASPAAVTDQTSLSVASTLVSQALSLSDVRTDRVASLQQAIAAGTYSVSSADVADKLLQSLLG